MIKRILVAGGTGLLGFPVARQLVKDGFETAILTTSPEKAKEKYGNDYTYVRGDVRDRESLAAILEGYEGIHINLNSSSYRELEETEVRGCRNLAEAAQKTGIRKITLISGLGVSETNAHRPFIKAKLNIENTIKSTGIPFTIFNCTHFMESIPLYIRKGKAMIMGKQAHGIHWLAADDYAGMVSKSYVTPASDGHNYTLIGPEAYTMRETFEKYIAKKDPAIKITGVSLGMLGIIANLTFNAKLKFVVDLMRYFDETPEKYDPTKFPDMLGKADTTLEEWLERD